VLNESLGLPLESEPGYLVVQAESASKMATNAFVYTVGGRTPSGAEQVANLGFGPDIGNTAIPLGIALFGLGVGALLVVGGEMRRREEVAAWRA
jgi:hypothetical protein